MHIALFSLPLCSQRCNYLKHLIKPSGSLFLPLSILLYCLHYNALNQPLVLSSRWVSDLSVTFSRFFHPCHLWLFLLLSILCPPPPRTPFLRPKIYFPSDEFVRTRRNSKILNLFFTFLRLFYAVPSLTSSLFTPSTSSLCSLARLRFHLRWLHV